MKHHFVFTIRLYCLQCHTSPYAHLVSLYRLGLLPSQKQLLIQWPIFYWELHLDNQDKELLLRVKNHLFPYIDASSVWQHLYWQIFQSGAALHTHRLHSGNQINYSVYSDGFGLCIDFTLIVTLWFFNFCHQGFM